MAKGKFRNILIVRTDRIGDVVITTSVLKPLRGAFPEARISMLVTPATKALVSGNPYINEILVDDRQAQHKGLFGFIKLIRKIKQKKYDLAVIYHTKKRTNALCFLARIPYRLGYKNNKFGFLINHPIEDRRVLGTQHEAQYCLDVLETIGVKVDSYETRVSIDDESEKWLRDLLAKNKIDDKRRLIAIHPGASDPSKCWPYKKFAELIEILIKKYSPEILIIGSEETVEISRKIDSIINKSLLDLTGKTTVSQLASLLRRCALLVSNDSGPVHIASGVGTPVVSIFTRNQPGINSTRWRPLGKRSKFVSVAENNEISFQKAGNSSVDYLELIQTQEVLEAVDAIFKL